MQTLSRRGRVSDGGQVTFPFLKVTKFPNDVLFFHRISLQRRKDVRARCARGTDDPCTSSPLVRMGGLTLQSERESLHG